jgi:flagellar biogenesis protein FliO
MTAGAPEIAWPALTAVALVTVLGLAAHWWLRRNGLVAGTNNPIKLIATRSMGAKRALAIVEVGTERFLVGLTDERISLVSNLESERRATAKPQPFLQREVANAK